MLDWVVGPKITIKPDPLVIALKSIPISAKAREDYIISKRLGNEIRPGGFFPKYPAWGMYPIGELRELLAIIYLVSSYQETQLKPARDRQPVAPRSIQEQRKLIERQQAFDQQIANKLPRGGFPDAKAG